MEIDPSYNISHVKNTTISKPQVSFIIAYHWQQSVVVQPQQLFDTSHFNIKEKRPKNQPEHSSNNTANEKKGGGTTLGTP